MNRIVYRSRIDLLDALLNMGADVNAGPDRGYTPLMQSAFSGDLKMTQALIVRGATLNALSQDNHTPLGQALRYGENPALITMLLQNGARCQFFKRGNPAR